MRCDLANQGKWFAHLSSYRSSIELPRVTAGYVRRPSPGAAPLRRTIACTETSGTYVDSNPGRSFGKHALAASGPHRTLKGYSIVPTRGKT